MNISLGFCKSMYSKEVTAITSLPMLFDILKSSVNYVTDLHNSCVRNRMYSKIIEKFLINNIGYMKH